MRLFNICVFLISLTTSQIGAAQTPDPLDFFPHHLGDVWEYWVDAGSGYINKQNEIIRDSLGNDGRFYIEATPFGTFVLDTTTFEVFKSYGTLDRLYRLDADAGDSWIVWQDSSEQHQGSCRL